MDEEPGGKPVPRFLPPMPVGPEPDLGGGAGTRADAPAHGGFLPPQGAVDPPPPAAGWSQQPVGSGGGTVPDNGDAVAGLILSVSAAVLLVLSVGMSTIISVVCAALGVYYSRKGRARVDRGETPRNRGMAQAGFVTGIVALVLSVLMTIMWAAVAILYATDEDFRQSLEDELDGETSPDGFETAIPLGLAALRGIALLLR